jgi:hypothetical protein
MPMIPPTAVHTARTAPARTVRVQVLTPPGALTERPKDAIARS